MNYVKPKKNLGQHFLIDKNIGKKIVNSLRFAAQYKTVLEVGPGMGALSDYLLQNTSYLTYLIDLDPECLYYLQNKYPQLGNRLIHGDFLKLNIRNFFSFKLSIIGNFPYNISSQILFKILEHRDQVIEVVGMFQKEVAQRCAEKPGSKDYGILSVFLQAYYHVEYLFTVKAQVFYPPPKVQSAVLRLTRNEVETLNCDEQLFWKIVKAGFNQRRKTLRNALASMINKTKLKEEPLLELRAERLSVADFINLTNLISASQDE